MNQWKQCCILLVCCRTAKGRQSTRCQLFRQIGVLCQIVNDHQRSSNFIKGDHPLHRISHQCSILLMVLLKGGVLEAASVLRSSLAALWKAVKIQNKSLNTTRRYWEPFECDTNLENRRPSWGGGGLHLKLNRSRQKCQIRCASPLILQKGWVIKALFLKMGAILQSSDL